MDELSVIYTPDKKSRDQNQEVELIKQKPNFCAAFDCNNLCLE